MTYTPIFLPRIDVADAPPYDYADETLLAINVALVTNRPLLLRGVPGCGKTTLAVNLASQLGRRYYSRVVTSRMEARDLLWEFDALRRLQEAQVAENDAKIREERLRPERFLKPGIVWWAIAPEQAKLRGILDRDYPTDLPRAEDPWKGQPFDDAVVLIDEIDKADPDVPNDMLEVLELAEFVVEETGSHIKGHRPVIVITTNEERELPPAFLRRCVVHMLSTPDEKRMMRIGQLHFPNTPEALLTELYGRLLEIQATARAQRIRPPSTAEYLDALKACLELQVDKNDDNWSGVMDLTLRKIRADSAIDPYMKGST